MKKEIKIVTIGGGSSYTPELAEGFIKRMKDGKLNIKEWWLVDINEGDGPKKLDIIVNLVKRMFLKEGLNTKIIGTLDRREALQGGADFVTTQLRVGRMQAREKDERIPLSNGFIGQETNGAGGLFKALRTIPVVLDIVKDVKELANGAWIVNFTNPSGIVTQAVAKYGDYERFIGVCNLPIGTRIEVSRIFDVHYKELNYDMAGLNHFVYFSKFYVKGEDVTERVLTLAQDPKEYEKYQPENVKGSPFDKNLIKQLKALPCGYHRYYYNRGSTLKEYLDHFKNNTTRAEVVMRLEDTLFEKYKDPNLNVKPKELEKRGGAYYSEVACSVVAAIHNNTGEEIAVSTVNKNHVQNWPEGLTVETVTRITDKGPMPVNRDIMIPEAALPLVRLMKKFEILTCEAAVEKDSEKALLALQINPLSEDSVIAKKVFNELVEAHKDYLDGIEEVK